jgi:(1->4)-alpha-D-glucan 1-alpha-D-glucosylmutase
MLIRLTAPGVPDVYQGNESWEFSLVDPDNRRAVDYGARQRGLRQIQQMASSESHNGNFVQTLTSHMEDGCLKMYVLWQALKLRKSLPGLFREGTYLPVPLSGAKAKHAVAFLRQSSAATVLVVVPRFCSQLTTPDVRLPVGEDIWGDCAIHLPDTSGARFGNVFTGEWHEVFDNRLHVGSLLRAFPVALLSSEPPK